MGQANFDAAVGAPPAPVPAAGPRLLEPFDCAGLTGFHCCILVKNAVRDHDANGKAIQCYLEYTEGTGKRNYMNEEGGKKIKILANHLGYVSIEPHIEGSWDAAATVTTAAVTTAVVTTAFK